jgi:hypothetical protein
MDSVGLSVSLLMALVAAFLIFTLPYSVGVKILERRLTFIQSLLISAVATGASIALMVVYFLSKPLLGLDRSVDGVATIVMLCVIGTIITRLARNYGIEKSGRFGLGARASFWILIGSWVVVSAVFGIGYLMGN